MAKSEEPYLADNSKTSS